MKNKNGCYDILVRTSSKYASKVALRFYDEEEEVYKCYTYSEVFGTTEYIAQQLHQLDCNRGVIGLISRTNIIVPCVVAAAHKCATTFMFLDPSKDASDTIQEMDFTVLITIVKEDGGRTIKHFYKRPDKIITVFGFNVCFYSFENKDSFYAQLPHMPSFIAMTSGSTGTPKKIQVPVNCIKPNIDDLTKLFEITSNDVIYFSTPLTFDPSMVEMLLACMNGASLLIAPGKSDILFPHEPHNKQHSVTVWQTTPSMFFQFSNAHIKSKILSSKSTLKILALGGEPLNGVRRLRELKHRDNKTKIYTLYGVTEMSCWACVAELDLSKTLNDNEVPLGCCLSETEVKVDSDGPSKNMGNIIISSKTRNCFVVNTKNKEENITSIKFVNTGDVGEVKPNGTIYYRGRRDDIIKRFGHKINLQFIESTVMYCPRVKACSCVWLPKPRTLIVYFTSDSFSSQDLSDLLRCKLDDKHWPDRIVRVNNLPTNYHGKVSKIVLAKLAEESSAKHPLPKVTNNSLKVAFLQEVKHVLNTRVTYDDIKHKTFMDIGGTSFLAVQLCNALGQKHAKFGRLLLPYLLTPKKNIDQIINTVEELCSKEPDEVPKKKIKVIKSKSPSPDSSSRSSLMLTKKTPVEFVEMWTYNSGRCVDASPSVLYCGVNLYVTVGSHSGRVATIDGLTGTVVGVLNMGARVEAAACCYAGDHTCVPCAVVGAYDGTILCYAIETSKELWRTNVGSMVKSKAVVARGGVYVAAYDGFIRRIDLVTGQASPTSTYVSDQAISADLALAKKDYIMVASLSGVCAGFHIPTDSLAWRASMESPIFASPVVYADEKYVVFAEVSGEIHCRTVEKGIKIWKFSAANGKVFSSIHVKEIDANSYQMVFGCYDHHLYSITVKNFKPSIQWRLNLGSPIYSTPSGLAEDFILSATNEGTLNVISAKYGVRVSTYTLPNETFSTPAVFGDYIFIGCRNDLVYSLKYVINTWRQRI